MFTVIQSHCNNTNNDKNSEEYSQCFPNIDRILKELCQNITRFVFL